MAGDKEESSGSGSGDKPVPLHPAYTVTNIQTKIRTLDDKKLTYSSWVKLFKLHAKAYKVIDHIDGTPPPDESDAAYAVWTEIDALVLQWIYSTVSDGILDRVIDNNVSAYTIWTKIEEIYLNNKVARAASLLHEFTNTKLANTADFDTYCQKLKTIAVQLADVEQPVDETRLVIQLVDGLPPELDTIGTIVNQSTHTWDSARNRIQMEINRKAARSGTNREDLLIHSQNPNVARNSPQQVENQQVYQSNYRGNNFDPNYRGRGRTPWRGGGRNRGRGQARGNGGRSNFNQYPGSYGGSHAATNYNGPQAHMQSPHTQHWAYLNQPTPPPTPYPSQQSAQPGFGSQVHLTQQNPSGPPGFGPAPLNALSPSDIGTAFQTMNLNYGDPWHMDTGASSHITSNAGPQGWTPPFPSQ